MNFWERLIEFENSEKDCSENRRFRIEINEYECTSKDFSENRIYIRLLGLAHPLNNKTLNYYGEETHNPQLKRAADLVERIFIGWRDDFKIEAPEIFREDWIGSMKPGFEDSKEMSIRVSGVEGEAGRVLYERIEDLIGRIYDAKPDIEREIYEGGFLALEDPNFAIYQAHTRYVCEQAIAGRQIYVHPGLARFAEHFNAVESHGNYFYPLSASGIAQMMRDNEELPAFEKTLEISLN